MSICDLGFMRKFIEMCEDGWRQGWHERNGGNLSYCMTEEETEATRLLIAAEPGDWTPIGLSMPGLGGQWFAVTGSGKYFHHVKQDPEDCLTIIEINSAGEKYRRRWGLSGGGVPTSELPTHLLNHEAKQKQGSDCRVIYHSHPVNLIALTFLLPPGDEIFTKTLWGAIAECVVVFPNGVGVLPWMLQGGLDIAAATAERMERYDAVVWGQHGIFCGGADFDATFGLTHTIEKAAEVFLKVHSAGGDLSRALTMENIGQLEKAFSVKAQKHFLS